MTGLIDDADRATTLARSWGIARRPPTWPGLPSRRRRRAAARPGDADRRLFPARRDRGSAALRADVLSIIDGHWRVGQHVGPGEVKIRVFNPRRRDDRYGAAGWSDTRTVIDIVNDDMPFLVESVIGTLTSANVTVHRVLHPILISQRDADGELLEIDRRVRPGAESRVHRPGILDARADRPALRRRARRGHRGHAAAGARPTSGPSSATVARSPARPPPSRPSCATPSHPGPRRRSPRPPTSCTG